MPKKKAEFQSEEQEEYVWDFRKIGIGIVVLLLLIFGGLVAKRLIMGQSVAPESFIPHVSLPSVKGASTDPADTPATQTFSLPTQQDVQQQVQQIQQQITHLDVQEIASSSPQVQQVLQQIQNLPKQSSDQVKQACYRLCDGL